MNNILKNLFTNKKATEIKDNSIIKIVVVDFVCHNNIYANTLFDALNNTNFKATLFTEKFNKHFLNLNKRTFFDLIDYGNTILNKEQADVLIWGYQEGDNIRINFHTKHSFANWDNLSFGILESVDIPTKYLKNINSMPSEIYNIIAGLVSINLSKTNLYIEQEKTNICKNIKRNIDLYTNSNNFQYSASMLNAMALILMRLDNIANIGSVYNKNLLENSLKIYHDENQSLNIGYIYKNLGYLYENLLYQNKGDFLNNFNSAMYNYKQAENNLINYNSPYDCALISFKIANLNFKYWRFTNDLQALRTAIACLKETKKTFTKISFPILWGQIEGILGQYLLILGYFSNNNDILNLSIANFENQETIFNKNNHPVKWANIQENIANVYYCMSQNKYNTSYLNKSFEYNQAAFKIYEAHNLQEKMNIININISRILEVF